MKFLIAFILSIFLYTNATAQYLEFVENKGQWYNNIAFKADMTIGAIALKNDGGYRMLQHNTNDLDAIHNYYHPHAPEKTTAKATNQLGLHSHVYEVSFLGANPSPEKIVEKPLSSYNNYFIGNDKSKWASGCKIYQAITYKNIYPNIDVRYYTANGTLKYDFIVRAGGNPQQIALVFDGADNLKVKKGNLEITTSIRTEKELSPYTYQPTYEGRKEIGCSYKVTGNIVSFKIDDYDKTQTLIIDPTKIFATFSGSTADNWGFTATYDNAGNFYGGGIVFAAGFPITNGSSYQGGVQSDDGDDYDIGIIKFDPTGAQRLYATYIGGSVGNDQPHSLVCDVQGNLYISGRTSSANYPQTLPMSGTGGGTDILITKLDNSGNILSSRVIGGSNDDGKNIHSKYAMSGGNLIGEESLNRNYGDDARSEIILDDNGNVLIASCTQSTDFFTTANAFQKASGSASSAMTRKQDGVFIKLSSTLATILTSTYLGGDNDDAAFVLAINPINQNIYIAGGTASTNFPGNKTNVIGATYNGGTCDGFVAVLNSAGTSLLQASYFGTAQNENIYGIQFDKFGFVYIMGTTTGNWVVLNVAHVDNGAKQYISKIKNDLTAYIYSTTFGKAASIPSISPTAFLVDRCENVYVSGWGGTINSSYGYVSSSTLNLPITDDALQKTTDGSDFYFYVLERNGRSQLYGDFMGQTNHGGEHVDGGTSRFDKNGVIYQSLCGNCGGPNNIFPTTPGAWSTINRSSNCNLAAVKIAFNLTGVGAGVRSSIRGVDGDTLGCVPLTVRFHDTLAQGISYTWNFGDGSPIGTTKKPDTSHLYTTLGTYKVCVASIDSSTCNIVDTSCRTIVIRDDSAHLALAKYKIGDCRLNQYEFDNRYSTFPPAKPFKNNSFVINFGDGVQQSMGYGTIQHQYVASGIYNGWMALVDTNYCNTPDTLFFSLEVIVNVKAKFTPPPNVCTKLPIQFTDSSSGAITYEWYINDVLFSTAKNPTYLFNTTGIYTIKLVVENMASCNKRDSISHTIQVNLPPTADFTFSPDPPQINKPVNYFNQSTGAVNYVWMLGEDDTVRTNDKYKPIQHLYHLTKDYNVCLVALNIYACPDTMCKIVAAKTQQLYDVPSAFSPNGDNRNDKIFVRGYGIKKIDWKIYNRWGILVFQSSDIATGWDGRYKGEIQPQEVYHYTLNVDFWDDTKAARTGDITLLR